MSEDIQSRFAASVEESSIKETIESIAIAFVLAFVFRAFVVEAFVIPTGSMAPTLLGAHLRIVCPECGDRFNVGARDNDRYNQIGRASCRERGWHRG